MDRKELGCANRLRTLNVISVLGYATTKQITKILRDDVGKSSLSSTTRMLRAMRDEKLIVTSRIAGDVNKEQIAGLAARGARFLSEEIGDETANTRDYLRNEHEHRTACNNVFCALEAKTKLDAELFGGMKRGLYSELEIRQENTPLNSYKYHHENKVIAKIPDLLMELENGEYQWFEIENAWRSAKDLEKIISCLQAMRGDNKTKVRVEFVVTKDVAKSIKERIKVKLLHTKETGVPRLQLERDKEIWEKMVSFTILDSEELVLYEL